MDYDDDIPPPPPPEDDFEEPPPPIPEDLPPPPSSNGVRSRRFSMGQAEIFELKVREEEARKQEELERRRRIEVERNRRIEEERRRREEEERKRREEERRRREEEERKRREEERRRREEEERKRREEEERRRREEEERKRREEEERRRREEEERKRREEEERRKMEAERKRKEEEEKRNGELPPDWREYVDKKTGKTYYYNQVTKETTWKKPAPVQQQPKQQQSLMKQPTLSSQQLPANWCEYVDKNSGKKYYFNQITKETTWTRPSSSPVPQQQNQKPFMKLPTKAQQSKPFMKAPAKNVNDLPPDWSEFVDKNTGKKYYYNKVTKQTSWQKPGASSNKRVYRSSMTPLHSPIPELTQLPPNWCERVDNNGKTYYYNQVTKETSWDRPDPFEQPKQQQQPLMKQPLSPQQLPVNWCEYVDKNSGKKYYFNQITKETTWTRPSPSPIPQQQNQLPPPSKQQPLMKQPLSPQQLPANWCEYVDKNSGKKYYFNQITKETTWTRPSQ